MKMHPLQNPFRQLLLSFLILISAVGLSNPLSGDTAEVWDHHIAAWEARDLDAIASDYSETSVLVINNQVYVGPEQIKPVFARLFEIFDAGTNAVDEPLLIDRLVYITWHFQPEGAPVHHGTDSFVIENGKIVYQTIASTLYEAFPINPIP